MEFCVIHKREREAEAGHLGLGEGLCGQSLQKTGLESREGPDRGLERCISAMPGGPVRRKERW